jgi:hypothetical protein
MFDAVNRRVAAAGEAALRQQESGTIPPQRPKYIADLGRAGINEMHWCHMMHDALSRSCARVLQEDCGARTDGIRTGQRPTACLP